MVTMGIFPFKEKTPWLSRESNPGPHDSSQKLWPLDHETGHTLNMPPKSGAMPGFVLKFASFEALSA
jgi:hypothetical protein